MEFFFQLAVRSIHNLRNSQLSDALNSTILGLASHKNERIAILFIESSSTETFSAYTMRTNRLFLHLKIASFIAIMVMTKMYRTYYNEAFIHFSSIMTKTISI